MVGTFGRVSSQSIGDMTDDEFANFLAKSNRTKDRINKLGLFNGLEKNNDNGANSTNTNSGLFGGISGIDDITKQAKDMAEFRLGLDFRGMDKAAQLRENESQANFGRTSKLTDQTFNWHRMINQDTEGARTQRNTDVLNREREKQKMDIDQENFATRRAIGLASRRLGA